MGIGVQVSSQHIKTFNIFFLLSKSKNSNTENMSWRKYIYIKESMVQEWETQNDP